MHVYGAYVEGAVGQAVCAQGRLGRPAVKLDSTGLVRGESWQL